MRILSRASTVTNGRSCAGGVGGEGLEHPKSTCPHSQQWPEVMILATARNSERHPPRLGPTMASHGSSHRFLGSHPTREKATSSCDCNHRKLAERERSFIPIRLSGGGLVNVASRDPTESRDATFFRSSRTDPSSERLLRLPRPTGNGALVRLDCWIQ